MHSEKVVVVSPRPVHKAASSKLHEIYDEMRNRQKKAILQANSMRSDPYFVPDHKIKIDHSSSSSDSIAASLSGDVSVDKRRCFAISAIIDNDDNHVRCSWKDKYFELQDRLKEEFGHYGLTFSQEPPVVGGGQLHWTLMQLVGFSDYSHHVENDEEESSEGVDSTFLSSEYLDCIQDSLTVGGLDTAIHMHYVGVIAVATGLLMIGVPSLDINETRDVVRARLKQHNLPLMEPFVNDIVHSTLFRVAGDSKDIPPDLHHRILKLAEEYKDVSLGTVVLSKFQIGPASWRLLQNEIADTPPVRQWVLPIVTPCENYNATIVSEEDGMGRECYTISGASGNNLAKEVRNFLNKQDSRSEHPDNSTQQPLLSISPNGSQYSNSMQRMQDMKNDIFEVRERIDVAHVRDSVPRILDTEKNEGYTLENSSYTLTGIGGANLALELKKKLDEEQKLIDNAYYTDFY